MGLTPQDKLETRWRTVQVLFKPNGEPTAWGAQVLNTFARNIWILQHASGSKTRLNPELMTNPVTLGKSDSPAPLMETTAEGWRMMTGASLMRGGELSGPEDNLKRLNLSLFLDPCLSPEETALAFKKEGWGALLEAHPRGCVAFRLGTAHQAPPWEYNLTIESILILPHPHDQVSQEHRMHAFELEGGGVACWDPDGLTLSDGEVLWGRMGGGLVVSTQSYHLPVGSWQREAMREASVTRGASYGGLRTLGHRLGVQRGAVPHGLPHWDPSNKRRQRAQERLEEATLALAQAFAEHAFLPEGRRVDPPPPPAPSPTYEPYDVFLSGFRKQGGHGLGFGLRVQWGTPRARQLQRFWTGAGPVWTLFQGQGSEDFNCRVLFLNVDWNQTFNLDTEEGFRDFLQKLTQEGLKDLDKLLKDGW